MGKWCSMKLLIRANGELEMKEMLLADWINVQKERF